MKTLTLLTTLFLTAHPLLAGSLQILAWDNEVAARKLTIGKGEKTLEVPYMHPSARTTPITIPEDTNGLRLVAPDRPGEDGKPLSIPLAIPAGTQNPLVILMPDRGTPFGLKPVIVEDAQSDFKWGTMRIFNITNKKLAFGFEKKGVKLSPGWKPVDIEPGGKSRNLEAFLFLADNLQKPFYTAVWEHRSDMRQLVFLVPSSNAALGPVECKFVTEVRLAEKPKP
ncbi:hypothetical protein [Roseibacillus persicicus]|uniref:Uncharacterized protein n=1 Tax=Roseibacillus persicicus TaxID=454148 RepID=A0A918WMP5_9BACT|nr:hypothetical protein [Roseibacillus persicicus]GHC60175.1 hypothetical protein GCM10007100_29300 [Roseibacillus persicicus]